MSGSPEQKVFPLPLNIEEGVTKEKDTNKLRGEDFLAKDLSIISEEASFNYKFYVFAFMAAFMLGTKLVLISLAHCNETWIFYLEHMAIWICCVTVITFTNGINNLCVSGQNSTKIFLCAFLSGATNSIGNVFVIFAMKHAMKSGTSPATITTILMFNVLIILVAGLTIFNEQHRPMKYLGGFVVFCSLILITTQRKFETKKEYTELEDASYSIAIFWVILTTFFWGLTAIFGKYASYFYNADPLQFGGLAMTCSGLFGSCSIVFLLTNSTPFGLEEGYNYFIWVMYWLVCGTFTALACFCFFKALSLGSAEITQLIVNNKILVQMIEELIIFGLTPTFVAALGMIGVFTGVCMMIFTKEKRNLRHDPYMDYWLMEDNGNDGQASNDAGIINNKT